MLDFNTVYALWGVPSGSEPVFIHLVIGARPFRLEDYRVISGWEWIPNNDMWHHRRAEMRIEEEDSTPDRIVAAYTAPGADPPYQYIFEKLTLERLVALGSRVSGSDQITKSLSSDAEVQEYFRHDWMRDDWKERPE